MYKLSIFTIAGLALLSSNAFAEEGDVWANVHFASKHTSKTYYDARDGSKHKYNEVNPGAGFEVEMGDNYSVIAGGFKNSVDELAFYGGVDLHTSYANTFGVSVKAGMVTGYEALTGNALSPMVMPGVNIVVGPVRTTIGVIPGIGDAATAFTISAGYRF